MATPVVIPESPPAQANVESVDPTNPIESEPRVNSVVEDHSRTGEATAQRQDSTESSRPQRAVALAFLSQGISSATNFFRLVFIVRVCSEATVGVYALGMTIVLLMFALHERLVEAPYTVFAHRRRDDSGRALLGSTALFSAAVTGAASIVVFLLGVGVWLADRSSEIGPMLAIVGLAAPPIVLRELARSAAFTHFRMGTAVIIDLATLLLQTALLAYFWWTGTTSIATLYAAIALSSAAAVGGWLWVWRDRWTFNQTSVARDWSELWRFSRWLLAARVMGNASRMVIPWIVFAMLGKADAGFLATCASLVGLAWLFVRGVNNYFRPYVVKAFCNFGPAAVRKAVLVTGMVFTCCTLPICLVFAFGGDWLLVGIYGDKLAGAGMVVFVLALNVLFTAWAIAGANGLMAIDRPSDSLWGEGFTLLATLIAAAPLIHWYGLVGAAVAMLLGNLVGAAIALMLLERGIARTAWEGPAHA